MHLRCARFPVARLGLRCSVFGPRRRTGSGAGYLAFRLGSRCSVSGPRPWKDEGQGRYDFPPILRPGRGPRTQGRTPNLVPGTWDPGPGTGFAPRAGYRTPSRGTGKRAHRVCMLGFEGGAWNG
jgi:hypothetical protein